MSAGNGHARAALEGDTDAARMLLNAYMYEAGLGEYAISKERWATRLRPSDSLVAAVRRLKDQDE